LEQRVGPRKATTDIIAQQMAQAIDSSTSISSMPMGATEISHFVATPGNRRVPEVRDIANKFDRSRTSAEGQNFPEPTRRNLTTQNPPNVTAP
jgi:hypothetical protein